jgi:hypothetical protein
VLIYNYKTNCEMEKENAVKASEGEEVNPDKPRTPDVKPQPDTPEIKREDKPEVSPDIPEKPEMPSRDNPAEPEIQPGKTKEPEVPRPAPKEPHE